MKAYKVLDIKTGAVFRGSAKECADRLGIAYSSLASKISRSRHQERARYIFVEIGKTKSTQTRERFRIKDRSTGTLFEGDRAELADQLHMSYQSIQYMVRRTRKGFSLRNYIVEEA